MSYDTDWHYVGEEGEPDFKNSVHNYSTTERKCRFIKTIDGSVRIEGNITGGVSGAIAFTLPLGYRPDEDIIIPSTQNLTLNAINVDTDGNVSGWKYFNWLNVSFYVGPANVLSGADGEDGDIGPTGPTGPGFATYDPDTNYGINAIVASMGVAWISQKDNNEDVTPGTNTANWKEAFKILTPYDEISGGNSTTEPDIIISGGSA